MRSNRVLIRGGYVLSMDRDVGEMETGDVLVEDGRIARIAAQIDAGDCDVIEAAGHVVMPGFVDTHRHTWQTQLRALCADWTLMDYFRGIRQTISPRYTADDVYAGNLLGSLEALDAGVTTILDFSHCNNTPEHADAALKGLHDAGIRAPSSAMATSRRRASRGGSSITRPGSRTPGASAPSTSARAMRWSRWASRSPRSACCRSS